LADDQSATRLRAARRTAQRTAFSSRNESVGSILSGQTADCASATFRVFP